MIISSHKALKKQAGLATLMLTIILLVTATLIIMFAAGYTRSQQRISGNLFRNQQAYAAAQAGLEYGINYLRMNSAAILASPNNGYIGNYTSANTTNVTLANNSQYNIVYTNPVAFNYNLILITSTGTSDDGTATRVVSQDVQYGSMILNPGTNALVSLGAVTMTGNTTITNSQSNSTIESGSTVGLSGNSETITSAGISSTPGHIKSDIQQNAAALQGLSSSDFFAQIFGVSATTYQNNSIYSYTNSTSTNYSSTLNNKQGTTIWINQTSGTATINGNTVIGSPSKPVLLVISGNLTISGNVTIYGFVYATGPAAVGDITGNVSINGAIVSSNPITFTGNTFITYSPSIISALQTNSVVQYYAKVPGSWADF